MSYLQTQTLKSSMPTLTTNSSTYGFRHKHHLWPETGSGVRRASVNSFGYGGTNAHVVLDDVQSYLKAKRLIGHHHVNEHGSLALSNTASKASRSCELELGTPRLLVFSAFDEEGVRRQATAHYEALSRLEPDDLDDYACALSSRRDVHAWKSFSVLSSNTDIRDDLPISKPRRSPQSIPVLGFVFTGQGAQWHGMGRELLISPVFRDSITKSQRHLERLGWRISLLNFLNDPKSSQLLDRAQYSQIVTTCIQIAIADVFRWLELSPAAVVGHSSGEIAAAYYAGYLDHNSAIKVSYYRGLLSSTLEDDSGARHSMAAIGASAEDVRFEIAEFQKLFTCESLEKFTISCINSPQSVTVSGPTEPLSNLVEYFAKKQIFARLLKVRVGYHSPQMMRIASQYEEMMGNLSPSPSQRKTLMVSSTTGKIIDQHDVCKPSYWVRNMVSTVDFVAAIKFCCKESRDPNMKNLDGRHVDHVSVNAWLEIGPHSTLQGPLKQIWRSIDSQSPMLYASALVRKVSALVSILTAIGDLWLANFNLNMLRATSLPCFSERPRRTPLALPAYPFNHSVLYWEEPEANLDYRLRKYPHHDLLGTRFGDLRSETEAQWRFRIQVKNMPWVEDHKIQGSVVYPAAGSIVMVIEATKQLLASRMPKALVLQDVKFPAAIQVSSDSDTRLTLHLSLKPPNQSRVARYSFRTLLHTSDVRETVVCSGFIRGDFGYNTTDFDNGEENNQSLRQLQSSFLDAKANCADAIDSSQLYETMRLSGLEYGPAFQTMVDIASGPNGHAVASSLPLPRKIKQTMSSEFTVHPSRLDGIFQLGCATMIGARGAESMVPTRIGKLWISIAGFGHDTELKETAHSQVTVLSERNANFSITVIDEMKSDVKAHIEDLELTTVSRASHQRQRLEDAPEAIQHVQWKPDLDTMSNKNIIAYCQVDDALSPELEWMKTLHFVTLSYATLALQSMQIRQETRGSSLIAPSMEAYASWLMKHVDLNSMVDPRELDALVETLPSTPLVNAYLTIGQNLSAILLGNEQAFNRLPESMTETKLAHDLAELTNFSPNPLGVYVDCLMHKRPNLRVCEVGTEKGTFAASTPGLLADSASIRRYDEYVITEVEGISMAEIQEQLLGKQFITFKTLSNVQDSHAQGFTEKSFDVVIVNLADGNTSRNDYYIENAMALLRPGGRLILRELPTSNLLWYFMLGLRPDSIHPEEHDFVLSAGNLKQEVSFPNQNSPYKPNWNVSIYSLVEPDNLDDSVGPQLINDIPILVVDPQSSLQLAAASQFCKMMAADESECALSLSEAASSLHKASRDILMLVELGSSMLSDISAEDFRAVKVLLQNSRSMIWVKKADAGPQYALNEGMMRVSRLEVVTNTFMSLALEVKDRTSSEIAHRLYLISSMMRHSLSSSGMNYEPEYCEQNGNLCIPRAVQARDYDTHLFSMTEKPLVHMMIGDKKLRLAIRTLGVLDTLEFVADDSANDQLASDQVEVETRAVGVNFKDVMGLLGRVTAKNLGSELGGVVHAVGTSVTHVKPGDRVVVAHVDAFRTHVRAPIEAVHRLPDDVSFEAAASIPTVFRTAYFCLYNIAHLQKGETILIHRASGGTGQAAIQLAQMIGAIVYVTVGSQAKKQLIIEQYGIPEQNILYSRDTTFSTAIKRLTQNRGVDVVLNSLSGDLLEASWDLVAPFGRFIEIGLGDAYARQQLPMSNFRKGVSFSSFDLTNFMTLEFAEKHKPLMKSVWDLFLEKKIRPAYPLQVFPVEKMEDAFRLLNSGDSSGKILLQMSQTSVVPVHLICLLQRKRTFLTCHRL